MDSYIIRIYRRAGKKSRILVGIVEGAGTRRKTAFSNIEELWEILMRRESRDPCASHLSRRRLRKEVMSGTDGTGLGESAKGVRLIESTSES
jgi:hypothetical protein